MNEQNLKELRRLFEERLLKAGKVTPPAEDEPKKPKRTKKTKDEKC